MEVLGIFKDLESAAGAVDRLVNGGFRETDITSLTSVSYPEGVLVSSGRPPRFHWLVVIGGFVGACAGFLLAAGTAWVYPVKTGDKPIIALYPTAIVAYELTMLFALVSAIVGMFLEMGLPSLKKRPYDPAISEGLIGISVNIPPGQVADRAEGILKEAGAMRTITE